MKKKRILVVDDEPGMLHLAKIALMGPGLEIMTARDGQRMPGYAGRNKAARPDNP